MESIIVSPHIEKTGGTSVEKIYKELFGSNYVMLYSPLYDGFHRSSNEFFSRTSPMIDKIKYGLSNFPYLNILTKLYTLSRKASITQDLQDARVVHGHFLVDRVRLEDSLLAIVFREPLGRMLSQFNHWRRTKGEAEWRVVLPYDESVSFEDYAVHPDMVNYQSKVLCGKDITDFEFVGTTDRLDRFAQQLTRYANITYGYDEETAIPTLNTGNTRPLDVDPDFVSHFKAIHSDDYEVYQKALSIIECMEI